MSRRRTERPASSAYITPEGAKALNEEFDRLWNVERPRVTQEVADAAASRARNA